MESQDPDLLEIEPQATEVSAAPSIAPAAAPAENPALQTLFNLPRDFASFYDLKTFLDEVSRNTISLAPYMHTDPGKLEAPDGGFIIPLNPPRYLNGILLLGKFNRSANAMSILFIGKLGNQWVIVKTINVEQRESKDDINILLQRIGREIKFLNLRIPYWIEPMEIIYARAQELQKHVQDEMMLPHMVMPFVIAGITLDQFCLARQFHDIGKRDDFIAAVGLQICNALEFPHAHEITLRDLTTGNIMITTPTPENGFVVCLDGALMFTKSLTRITPINHSMGTPEFMAPEAASCRSPGSHLSDIYSLACVFYFMATGQYPFLGITTMEVLTKHVFSNVDRSKLDHVHPHLRRLILSMLEKQPRNRPQSVYEVAAELDQVLGESQLREYMGPAAEFAKRRADFYV